MWDNPVMMLRLQSAEQSYLKWCYSVQTAGRWPWKLESRQECVTAHLPNRVAQKMDVTKLLSTSAEFRSAQERK